MYLMIDNYDSFSYNLYALFKECNAEVTVIKNNEYIPADKFDGIILSPGPSNPDNSGTTLRYLKEYLGKKPIFGVCLGMQSIAYALGGKIKGAKTIKHGKVDKIDVIKSSVLYKNVPKHFNAVRYHSLAVDVSKKLITSVSDDDGVIMSIEDPERMFFGVQFHPESILSEHGATIVTNYLDFVSEKNGKGGKSMDSVITKVNSGEVLSMREAEILFEAMVSGNLTEAQIASALIVMRQRGESVDELAALVKVLNKHKKVLKHSMANSVDTCGTGGDGKSTVNVSTAVSIILAAMGHTVVKHGNKAQSGKVGAADILIELGLDLDYSGSSAEAFLKKNNYVFMFAPYYHPALKGIGKVRRELKVSTIFNFVGPLVNPANPDYQIIGIGNRSKLEFVASAIQRIGKNNITIYSSYDGYDEISSKEKTECIHIKDGNMERYEVDPADYFKPFDMPVVENNAQAKQMFLDGITGKDQKIVNIFALNTAMALKTMGVAELDKGFEKVKDAIISGKVMKKLKEMVNA